MKCMYHYSIESSKTKSRMNWQKLSDQIIWTIWSELLYELIINSEKDNKKKKREILEKINKDEIKIKRRIVNSQWIKSTLIIEEQTSSRMIIKKENYVFIVRKRNIKSKNTEIYNKKNQWKHEHE